MRQIGKLPDETAARRFSDFLLVQGISATVDAGNDGWVVWGHDEDQLEQARTELQQFQSAPDDPKYKSASDAADKLRAAEKRANLQAKKRQVDVRQQWNRPVAYQAPVTYMLMAISIMVAVSTSEVDKLIELCTDDGPLLNALRITPVEAVGDGYYRFVSPSAAYLWELLKSGQVWRPITPIFIHMSLLHILFNMMWLRDLGSAIEFRRKSFRFLGLVLLTAVFSNVAQYLLKGPTFGGMSGVVYGLFGYIWMKSKFDPESGFFLPPQTVMIMIGWLFLCMTGMLGPIANIAHVAGLISGMACGYSGKLLYDLGLKG